MNDNKQNQSLIMDNNQQYTTHSGNQLEQPNPLLKHYVTNRTTFLFPNTQPLAQLPGQFQHFLPNKLEFQCLSPLKQTLTTSKQTLQSYHDNHQSDLVYSRFTLNPDRTYFSTIIYDNGNNNITTTIPFIKKGLNLEFDSEFESANLFTAYQISENQYDLILQNDMNTRGNTKWFLFKVTNTKQNETVKLRIINMENKFSLFEKGMKISLYSNREFKKRNTGWFKDGFNIEYTRNNLIKEDEGNKHYYTLSFKYTFRYDNDTVYFAYSVPYTYTQLTQYLIKTINYDVASVKTIVTKKNKVYKLTIMEKKEIQLENQKNKKGIFLIARQNPGDTSSSYVMQGIINFLMQNNSYQSQFLLSQCIFKIIPMMNVDGVVQGNNKCDIDGKRMNNQWNVKQSNPIVKTVFKLFKQFSNHSDVHLALDLQSRSSKPNILFIGNNKRFQNNDTLVYPIMANQINPQFQIDKNSFNTNLKTNSAKSVLFLKSHTPQVYQVKSSQISNDLNEKIYEFSPQDHEKIGEQLLQVLFNQLYEEQTFIQYNIMKKSSLNLQIPCLYIKEQVINSLKEQIEDIDQIMTNCSVSDSLNDISEQELDQELNGQTQKISDQQFDSKLSIQPIQQQSVSKNIVLNNNNNSQKKQQFTRHIRASSLIDQSKGNKIFIQSIKNMSTAKTKEITDGLIHTPSKNYYNEQKTLSNYSSIQPEFSLRHTPLQKLENQYQHPVLAHKKQKQCPTPISLYIRCGLDSLKKERQEEFKEIQFSDLKTSHRKEMLWKENNKQFLIDVDRKLVCNMSCLNQDNLQKRIENIRL